MRLPSPLHAVAEWPLAPTRSALARNSGLGTAWLQDPATVGSGSRSDPAATAGDEALTKNGRNASKLTASMAVKSGHRLTGQ